MEQLQPSHVAASKKLPFLIATNVRELTKPYPTSSEVKSKLKSNSTYIYIYIQIIFNVLPVVITPINLTLSVNLLTTPAVSILHGKPLKLPRSSIRFLIFNFILFLHPSVLHADLNLYRHRRTIPNVGVRFVRPLDLEKQISNRIY